MRDIYAQSYFTDSVPRRTVFGAVAVVSFLAACGRNEQPPAEYVEFESQTYMYKLMRPSQWNYARIENPGFTTDVFEKSENRGRTSIVISAPAIYTPLDAKTVAQRLQQNSPSEWQIRGYQATTQIVSKPDIPSADWGMVGEIAPYVVSSSIRGQRPTDNKEEYDVILDREGKVWLLSLRTEPASAKSDVAEFKKMLGSFEFLPR